jgi:hypothetical protein
VKIPLPNLDDRRWADLVEEGRSLIPLYAPGWTDHNIHDPGITLLELFAWIAEMDIYQLNRISDEHRRRFMALVGITPAPPLAARTVVSVSLADAATSVVELKSTTELAAKDAHGDETRFRILDSIEIAPGKLAAIQVKDAKGYHDLTDEWQRGESFASFGAIPEPGSELYLGFDRALPQDKAVSLFFKFAGPGSGEDERLRLMEEAAASVRDCRPPGSECEKKHPSPLLLEEQLKQVPQFHWGRTSWEFSTEIAGKQKWLALSSNSEQVIDDTHAMTLDGRLVIKLPQAMTAASVGKIASDFYYLRCRFEAGAYDATPVIEAVILNGVRAEQTRPVATTWTIRAGVTASGNVPAPGDSARVNFRLDARGRISELEFEDSDGGAPLFTVLDYKPAGPATTGKLTIEAVLAGFGNGAPGQTLVLPAAPVYEESLRLFSLEQDRWREWSLRLDFDASTRSSRHFLLDATDGSITFGDGESGRVPSVGEMVCAAYRATRAEAGNLPARTSLYLLDSAHNRAVNDFDLISRGLKDATLMNGIAATGGEAAETVDHAAGRAIELMSATHGAVTLPDYEELARRTPGVRLARASARANLHPSFPCFKAPGIVTLIILPDMPAARPTPSIGLRRAVTRYINRRKVIGTRVEVVGPTYLEVAVRAKVKPLVGVSKAALAEKIKNALDDFFDPLTGGPDKTGWPFGRDVYRSEVMQVIDEVAGVDHVSSLDLIAEGCDPQCGNVCLAPTWLVAAGQHEIEVI